ncbi:MAG: hypothetical protein KJO13_07800, partial [Gammaproteobacteria bacterium]|nr:hypothetical protein [Gammaproteobacteria bacterium]
MKRLLLTSLLLLAATVVGAGEFETIKAKTFDKKKFVFPTDVRGSRLNVLFLAISADQDNGIYQQDLLLEWQAQLDQRDVFSEEVVAYHFPVLAGPPFFVKGIISRALKKSYDGKVPLDQAGVLFIDDLESFAAAADLSLDGEPTIVIADADGKPLQAFKG